MLYILFEMLQIPASICLQIWYNLARFRHPVCIFYLVLRALDTVEDDMTIPMETKVPLLKRFHTFLYDKDWCYRYSEEKDKEVLERFPVVKTYSFLVPLIVSICFDCLFLHSLISFLVKVIVHSFF